jgi:hypothetical protein
VSSSQTSSGEVEVLCGCGGPREYPRICAHRLARNAPFPWRIQMRDRTWPREPEAGRQRVRMQPQVTQRATRRLDRERVGSLTVSTTAATQSCDQIARESAKMKTKVTPRDYYDLLPDGDHAPGDLWTDLPTHGLLRQTTARGLVVTPSCDLMNRKVETITYLPVLLASEWLTSASFFSDVVSAINSALAQLDETVAARVRRDATVDDLDRIDEMLASASKQAASKNKNGSAIAKIGAGSRHLRRTLEHPSDWDPTSDLEELFGRKKWHEICEKLVRNSLRTDIYFLPKDEQDPIWSGLPTHAFVLFRYPLSAPIRLLDIAADRSVPDWTVALKKLEVLHPMAAAFASARPIKRIRLKDRFFSDLLSKYVGVYSRVGAPDFSDATVAMYAREMRADE